MDRQPPWWPLIRAALLIPGTLAVAIPALLLWLTGARSPGMMDWNLPAGALLILAGAALMGWTALLFRRVGDGTPAPWDPPRRLVIRGPYRWVRNPMIIGLLLVLFGEALLFRSAALAGWALLFLLFKALYLPLVEERGLLRRFGEGYRRYRREVPRWLPRPPRGH